MVFSSATFLFFFLPLALGIYYAALVLSRFWGGTRLLNTVLLCLSLLFYSWGESDYFYLLLISISINHLFAYLISSLENQRKLILSIGISVNLLGLAVLKYSGFFRESFRALAGVNLPFLADFRLPLGISFVTFHSLSYLIDIYRKNTKFRNGWEVSALYISLFPQLIAGPIIRFKDIAHEFDKRDHNFQRFSEGIQRFVVGLSKKILIANELGLFADSVFALPAANLTALTTWLGVAAYSLQIYFDFSGYSDMAIGLGRMFGFTFPENFRLPYSAKSVRDFWQRWHISLSSWFRDYLYIPLGGNRNGHLQTARNLFLVFFLCGLWHGASWNFVIWGLLHGAFLSLERTRFGSLLETLPKLIQHLYLLLVVMFLWVPFRADSLQLSLSIWKGLLFLNSEAKIDPFIFMGLKGATTAALLIGGSLALGLPQFVLGRVFSGRPNNLARLAFGSALFLLCLSEVAAGSYNPFIYFRF